MSQALHCEIAVAVLAGEPICRCCGLPDDLCWALHRFTRALRLLTEADLPDISPSVERLRGAGLAPPWITEQGPPGLACWPHP